MFNNQINLGRNNFNQNVNQMNNRFSNNYSNRQPINTNQMSQNTPKQVFTSLDGQKYESYDLMVEKNRKFYNELDPTKKQN